MQAGDDLDDLGDGATTMETLIAGGAAPSEIARAGALDVEKVLRGITDAIDKGATPRESVELSNYGVNVARIRELQVRMLTPKANAPEVLEDDGWDAATEPTIAPGRLRQIERQRRANVPDTEIAHYLGMAPEVVAAVPRPPKK